MATPKSPAKVVARAVIALTPTTKGGMAQLYKELSEVTKKPLELKTSADTKSLGKSLSGSLSATGQAFGRSLNAAGDRFNKRLKVGALGVAGVISGAIYKSVQGGFKRLSSIEGAEAMLEGLKFDDKQIKEVRDASLDAVRGTAFGLDEAVKAAGGAVAAGIKVKSQNGEMNLEQYLKLVADTAQQTGSELGDINSIFGKVQASGKASMQEINQLSDRGLPIRVWLEKSLGKTSEEIAKMVREGKIGTEELGKAITENIGGAALKAGDTTAGAYANMQAAQGRFGAVLLSGVFPQLKNMSNELTAFFDRASLHIEPIIDRLTEKFGPGFEAALSGSGERLADFLFAGSGTGESYAEKMITGLTEGLKSAAAAGQSFLETLEPFQPVLKAFGDLIAQNPEVMGQIVAYGLILNSVFGMIGSVVSAVTAIAPIVAALGGLGAIFAAVLPVLAGIAIGVAAAFAVDWIIKNWEDVKVMLGFVWEGLLEFLKMFPRNAAASIEFVNDLIIGFAERVGSFIGNVLGWVHKFSTDLAESIGRDIGNTLRQVVDGFTTAWDGFLNFVTGVGEWVSSVFSSIWTGLTGLATTLTDTIKGIINSTLNGILWLINKAIDGVNALSRGASLVTGGLVSLGEIPNIPSLATGGLVTQSTLAIVGDTPDGEYVIDRGVMDRYLRAQTANSSQGEPTIGSLSINLEVPENLSAEEVAKLIPKVIEEEMKKARRR